MSSEWKRCRRNPAPLAFQFSYVYPAGADRIETPARAVDLVREVCAVAADALGGTRETLVAVALNAKNRPIRADVVSVGTATASLIHPRDTFRAAIMAGASSIIVAHNHPSGDPAPSREDREITERLREAARVVGIDLLDHVVCGADAWHSFREDGYL